MKTSELIARLEALRAVHGDIPVAVLTLLGSARVDRVIDAAVYSETFLAGGGRRYPEPAPHLVLLK